VTWRWRSIQTWRTLTRPSAGPKRLPAEPRRPRLTFCRPSGSAPATWERPPGKSLLGRQEEAVAWYRRSIEANRTNPSVHVHLAASLALMGRLEEARTSAAAGLVLNPKFTIERFQALPFGDNPTYLAGRKLIVDGMRMAGLPEGAMKTS
jgi:hypothetical protein